MPEVQAQFKAVQDSFTRHMRRPDTEQPPEGLEDRRLAIYRDLLYNNVESFMSTYYPVLNAILPEQEWHEMIREYFASHIAHTPLFPQMPREFLRYLEENDTLWEQRYPWIRELAHYEWVEASMYIDTREIDWTIIDREADLLDAIPVSSPLVLPLCYEYPVHKISPEFQPEEKPEQPTCLIVFRDAEDEVGFMEVNPMTLQLLVLIQQNEDHTGRQLLEALAGQMGYEDASIVVNGGLQIMQQLQQRDIIPGARKSTD